MRFRAVHILEVPLCLSQTDKTTSSFDTTLCTKWGCDWSTTVTAIFSRYRRFIGRQPYSLMLLRCRLYRQSIEVLQRCIDICDRRILHTTTLHAPNDEEDPGDKFQETTENEAGNPAIEHAGIIVVARAGSGCPKNATANDEEYDGSYEKRHWPPLRQSASRSGRRDRMVQDS